MKKSIFIVVAMFFQLGGCDTDKSLTKENEPAPNATSTKESVVETEGRATDKVPDYALKICSFLELDRPQGAYNYPIYPGTDKWKSLENAEAMWTACQIDKSLVANMPTEDLVQSIIEYPLLFEVVHRYEYNLDFRPIRNTNQFKELLSRGNACSVLAKWYLAFKTQFSNDYPILVRSAYDIVCAQKEFVNGYTEEEAETIFHKIYEFDRSNDDGVDNTAWFLAGRLLNRYNMLSNSQLIDKMTTENETVHLFINAEEVELIKESIEKFFIKKLES